MKKLLVVVVVLAIALLGASAAMAGIANTKHDLSSGSSASYKNSGTTEICVFCHTPHGAATTVPLWNRTNTTTTFTLYTSTTFNATTTKTQPSGASLACLSCHDGTLALSSLLNQPNSAAAAAGSDGGGVVSDKIKATATTNLGSDLSNDHPVSFSYAESYNNDSGLRTEATVTNGAKVIGGRVECASCHDVHNAAGFSPFLRGTMNGSALCLGCHVK